MHIWDEIDEMIKGEVPVLVTFSTKTCTLCDMVQKITGEVQNELENGIKVLDVDVDEEKATTINFDSTYQIMGVPTMMLFLRGKLVWRHAGVMFKDDLLKKITPFLEEPQYFEEN